MATAEDAAPEPDWWTAPWFRFNPNAALGPTQRRILAHLAAHDGDAFKMSAIATALGISTAQANNGSRGLVNRGLAQIAVPVGTGRVRRVQVTPRGITYMQAHTDASQATPPVQ